MDEKSIIEILNRITDPETGQGLSKAGKIGDLKIRENLISFNLIFPNLKVPYKTSLFQACHENIQNAFPASQVHIHIEARKNDPATQKSGATPHINNIIAVASGKGGVGKSTVSSNLALGLKELGYRVGLLDADLYGPSIPTMFGLKSQKPKVQKIQGQPKLVPIESNGIHLMSVGFVVEPEQAVILRGPRLGGLIKQFLGECLWPELDVLIVDLPPGTGDIQLTLVQTVAVTGAIMVTTPQKVAVQDAIKAANMFRLDSINVPIIGVVENMSWFTPLELPENKYYIFGRGGGEHLADYCGTKLIGQIPLIQGVREAGDKGVPAVIAEDKQAAQHFIDMASNCMEQLQKRNASQGPTKPVFIKK